MGRELLTSAEAAKPKVQILIGADNNTFLVNGKKMYFTSQVYVNRAKARTGVPIVTKNIDAFFVLHYLGQNQNRWITHGEMVDALRTSLEGREPKKSSHRPYLNTRVKEAKMMLLQRIKINGVPLLSQQPSNQRERENVIGIMNFDLSVKRVLINLRDYPYSFNKNPVL